MKWYYKCFGALKREFNWEFEIVRENLKKERFKTKDSGKEKEFRFGEQKKT